MATQKVVEAVTKRRPTADEWEVFLGHRVPELIRQYKEGALDPSGVNISIQHLINGTIITEQKTVVVAPPKPKADKFELLTTFEVMVPDGYKHETRLADFKAECQPEVETEERKRQFCYYNPNITDANYGKATTKLVPGRKFQVKVFGIRRGKQVTSDECLDKVRLENGVLVGAQGASLAYEQGKDNLPKGKWYASFDEKEALWCNDGCHRVPFVSARSDGGFSFGLGNFENDWDDDDCLLCFCEIPAVVSTAEAAPLAAETQPSGV